MVLSTSLVIWLPFNRLSTSTVCSNYSFGDQCEKTCNCDGNEGCDDVTGTCAQSCLSGWKGPHCDKNSHNRGNSRLVMDIMNRIWFKQAARRPFL